MFFHKRYVFFIFMIMNIRLFSIIFFLGFFSSCNDPMDKTYNAATYVNDISEMRESNKVNYEDIELLTKYIAVSKIAGNDLEGKTYAEILNKIKDIRKANADQNDKIEFEREAARDRLSSYLSVNLSGKEISKVSNKEYFNYTVNFQNLTTKRITMVVGSISINDLLDREITNIQIILDEHLDANAILKKTYSAIFDESKEKDLYIKSKELVDLRVLWNPEKIIFEDGTIAQ